MAVVPGSFGSHPVLGCAERIGHELSAIADVPVELMRADEKAAALVALSSTADQLEALRLRLLPRPMTSPPRPGPGTPVPGWRTRPAPIAASSSETCSSGQH